MMQSALLMPDELSRDRQPGDALVLWLPVFLCLGIAVYFSLSFEPPRIVALLTLIVTLIGAIATWRWRDTYLWRWLAGLCVLVAVGFTLAQFRTQAMDTTFIPHRYFNAAMSGTITEVERMGAGWCRRQRSTS
jgi:competence protein ComEC